MLTLPDAILPVLHPFAALFRSPTWLKAQILLAGAILAPGQRTVAAALRVMGLSDDLDYARYHEVLNRAVWPPRQAARILLGLLILYLDQGDGPLIFGIDETLERRRGPKIKSLGIYRDAVRSSRSHLVKASGLRWVSLMWLGHVPWAGRYWALPFLTVLAPLTVISPHHWLEYLKYGFLPAVLQLGFPATHSATTGGNLQPMAGNRAVSSQGRRTPRPCGRPGGPATPWRRSAPAG